MIRYIQFELDEFRHLGDYIVYNRDELFGNKISSRLNSYDHIIYSAIDLKLITKSLHRILDNIYKNTLRSYESLTTIKLSGIYSGSYYRERLIYGFRSILRLLNNISMEYRIELYKILIKQLKKTRKYTDMITHRLALTRKDRVVISEFLDAMSSLTHIFGAERNVISTDFDAYPISFQVQLKSLSLMLEIGERVIGDILNLVQGNFNFATYLHRPLGLPQVILHDEKGGVFNRNYIDRFRLKLRCYSHIERNKIKEELYNAGETLIF